MMLRMIEFKYSRTAMDDGNGDVDGRCGWTMWMDDVKDDVKDDDDVNNGDGDDDDDDDCGADCFEDEDILNIEMIATKQSWATQTQ